MSGSSPRVKRPTPPQFRPRAADRARSWMVLSTFFDSFPELSWSGFGIRRRLRRGLSSTSPCTADSGELVCDTEIPRSIGRLFSVREFRFQRADAFQNIVRVFGFRSISDVYNILPHRVCRDSSGRESLGQSKIQAPQG